MVREQVYEKPIGGVQLDANVVNGPYLHHSTTITLLPCSWIHLESPNYAVLWREGCNKAGVPSFLLRDAAESGLLPTSAFDSPTFQLTSSPLSEHESPARARISGTLLREA